MIEIITIINTLFDFICRIAKICNYAKKIKAKFRTAVRWIGNYDIFRIMITLCFSRSKYVFIERNERTEKAVRTGLFALFTMAETSLWYALRILPLSIPVQILVFTVINYSLGWFANMVDTPVNRLA